MLSAAVFLLTTGANYSAKAQFYGADPAAVFASTYCAARAQGLDNDQASRRGNQSMAAAGDFTTLMVHMSNINMRKEYLAKQQCPEYFGFGPSVPLQDLLPPAPRPAPTKAEISKDTCALYGAGQKTIAESVDVLGLKKNTTKTQLDKYCTFYK